SAASGARYAAHPDPGRILTRGWTLGARLPSEPAVDPRLEEGRALRALLADVLEGGAVAAVAALANADAIAGRAVAAPRVPRSTVARLRAREDRRRAVPAP